ncbi:Fc.00g092890.m01.CDS01 [Cosmosporella sp. VM-42]
MSIDPCCLKGFEWDGTPVGHTAKLANLDTYVVGDNPKAAVLLIHDLFGWKFTNLRLLADHYAREANATVYLPDFFEGESLSLESLKEERWWEVDLEGFMSRHGRDVGEPLIFDCARVLREKHTKVGAVGFCYGGWAVFRLGSSEHDPPLVDCITAGHPSLLKMEDIDGVSVPTQVLAPQIDMAYNEDFKVHTFQTMIKKRLPFDYVHFPDVVHSCLVRGSEEQKGEREAMRRGKDAAVAWIKEFLSE